MSRTLSFDKKKVIIQWVQTKLMQALLVYYWERSNQMNKKLYPVVIICNTFIYFIFIVTENTTFGFATYFEIYTSQRLGYTNNKTTNTSPDCIGLTHQSTNLISLFNTKNNRKVTKLKPTSWNVLSQNNMPYCCYYTI